MGVAALLIRNLGGNFLHLHETYRRYRVRPGGPNRVGTFQRKCSSEFFCSGEIVAGPRSVVGADVVGLPFEVHAECALAGAGELSGKYAAGPYSAKDQAGIDCRSAGPSENLVGPLLFQMAEIGMRKLMSEHKRKLRIGSSDPHDARVNNYSVSGRKSVR
jgi:hypothetical protein